MEDNFTGGDSWRFGFIFGELTEHGGGALKRSADAERPKCEAVRVYDRDRGSFSAGREDGKSNGDVAGNQGEAFEGLPHDARHGGSNAAMGLFSSTCVGS